MGLTETGEQGLGHGDGRLLEIRPLADPAGLCLIGEVDLTNRHLLAGALEPYTQVGRDLYLDLSALSFIDVGGTTLLIDVAERLAPDLRLVLRHPPRIVCSRARMKRWTPTNVKLMPS